MKQKLWIGAALSLALGFSSSHSVHAGQVGLFTCLDFGSMLWEYPSSTTYLEYVTLDSDYKTKIILRSVDELLPVLKANRRIQEERGKALHLQLGVEIHKHGLDQFIAEMKDPSSLIRGNVRKLAQGLKDETRTVWIRPFSEMNDEDLERGPNWKLDPTATGSGNTPEKYAAAWMMLHDALRADGLTNTKFHFNVLAAKDVGDNPNDPGNLELTFKTLELIPSAYVDAFGMNVYARPVGAQWAPSVVDPVKNPIGTLNSEYVSFKELVTPWLDRLKRSSHSSLPTVIGEMGLSNQSTDARKAAWINEAFTLGRTHPFEMMTYFNCNRYNWAALPWSGAEAELKSQMKTGI